MLGYWSDVTHNPISSVYSGPMIDMGECAVWCWDARPYPASTHGLLTDLEATLCQHLAGRAAERAIFGEVSAGSGGTADSDLAKATATALAIHSRYGLGIFGPVWIGDEDRAQLRDPACRTCVRQHIEDAEARALGIVMANRDLLEGMAGQLVRARDIDEQTAAVWLDRVRRPVLPQAHEPAVDLRQPPRSGATP